MRWKIFWVIQIDGRRDGSTRRLIDTDNHFACRGTERLDRNKKQETDTSLLDACIGMDEP